MGNVNGAQDSSKEETDQDLTPVPSRRSMILDLCNTMGFYRGSQARKDTKKNLNKKERESRTETASRAGSWLG